MVRHSPRAGVGAVLRMACLELITVLGSLFGDHKVGEVTGVIKRQLEELRTQEVLWQATRKNLKLASLARLTARVQFAAAQRRFSWSLRDLRWRLGLRACPGDNWKIAESNLGDLLGTVFLSSADREVGMSLIVSHESALCYWLTKMGDECVPDYSDVGTLARATASMGEVREALLPVDYSEKKPLHLLVPDQQGLRSLRQVKTHLFSGRLPPGSLCELSGANYVSSPEFTFLQVAAGRSLIETLELGYYLCGSFSIGEKGCGYTGQRPPLTTPEDIARFLDSADGAHGVRKARSALRYLLPNAASPMEVLLVLAFVLPPRLGGWEFPEIQVNQRIDVDERLRVIAESDLFVGDIYIPSVNGDVEYDSEEFHTGRWRSDHTQARRNVLEVMDVKTMSATWSQISNFEKFRTFIWMVKERFGISHRAFTPQEVMAQMDLYEFLTDFNRKLF